VGGRNWRKRILDIISPSNKKARRSKCPGIGQSCGRPNEKKKGGGKEKEKRKGREGTGGSLATSVSTGGGKGGRKWKKVSAFFSLSPSKKKTKKKKVQKGRKKKPPMRYRQKARVSSPEGKKGGGKEVRPSANSYPISRVCLIPP